MRRWCFLAFVLLALPNCTLQTGGLCNPDDPELQCKGSFDPGPDPASDAIKCDIDAPVAEGVNMCATPEEAADPANVWLSEGAIALFDGRHSTFALDWSDTADCDGRPKKVEFLSGPFPDGLTVCLNCKQQIPAVYDSPTRACIAKCIDLVNAGNGPIPSQGTEAYCEVHARTGINFSKDMCFPGGCTSGGSPDLSIMDPRRKPEDVKWIDFDPADISNPSGGNTIQRIAATSTPPDFNKGAASAQTIPNGGAWVDFQVTETNLNHVLSLRESCLDPVNCPDTDHGLDAIGWAIKLADDGNVYVIESKPTLTVSGPIGSPYTVGEHFRVRAVDNHDGTATMWYLRTGACQPAPLAACPEEVIAKSDKFALYPLRVDTSLREQNATLANVTLMRLIPQP